MRSTGEWVGFEGGEELQRAAGVWLRRPALRETHREGRWAVMTNHVPEAGRHRAICIPFVVEECSSEGVLAVTAAAGCQGDLWLWPWPCGAHQ